jgi:DNA-directed RNA polymerase specialized sigma24 family protein
LGRNEDDLISEAIVATAEGHRVWKPDVDFFQHMLGAVRSISSSWRETRGEEYLESELAQEEGGSPFEQRGTTEDPERILSAVERLEQVRKLFARDAAASQVIELLGLGHTAKEIQSQLHMSPRDFGATAKRIRRRLGQWLGAEG